MASIAYEHDDLDRLITAKREHLLALRLQEARLGAAAPPHITTEIARYETEIERLTNTPPELTTREKHLIDLQWQMRYEVVQVELTREVRELRARVDALIDALAIRGIRATKRARATAGDD